MTALASSATARLRVVVADDSALMRRVLADALARHGFDVVAAAADGDEALTACERLRPDVLTLDLAMPGLDGIGVLRALQATPTPVPVVVVSAFSPSHGARAVDALAEGAVDLVEKPSGIAGLDDFITDLGTKVRLASQSRRTRTVAEHTPVAAPTASRRGSRRRSVVIACSTGGPRALAELLPRLPASLGAGAMIVQHMPAGFTESLAARLDRASALHVREARTGDALAPDTALIAPGGRHLRLGPDRRALLNEGAPIGGLRPRADLTISDAARAFGADLLLVVLTGMGRDGLEGAAEVRRAGGRILAEAESSCTVYGMPRAIVDAGLADGVHDLTALPDAIAEEAGR